MIPPELVLLKRTNFEVCVWATSRPPPPSPSKLARHHVSSTKHLDRIPNHEHAGALLRELQVPGDAAGQGGGGLLPQARHGAPRSSRGGAADAALHLLPRPRHGRDDGQAPQAVKKIKTVARGFATIESHAMEERASLDLPFWAGERNLDKIESSSFHSFVPLLSFPFFFSDTPPRPHKKTQPHTKNAHIPRARARGAAIFCSSNVYTIALVRQLSFCCRHMLGPPTRRGSPSTCPA
jgi:hypothetical protein